jgi:uncharacterized protein
VEAILLWVLAGVLVAAGIAGAILSILPGAPLVLAGLIIAAWIDGFHKVGWGTLAILGVLTGVSVLVDYFAPLWGAKRMGAGKGAMTGATLGTIGGMFFGLLGIIFGPLLGAGAGEFAQRRDVAKASKIALGTWMGLIVGTVVKLIITFVMIAIFAVVFFSSK